MKYCFSLGTLLLLILMSSPATFAQSNTTGDAIVTKVLMIVGVLILALRFIPGLKELFLPKEDGKDGKPTTIKLKKGYDIKIAGGIEDNKIYTTKINRVAVSPYNFRGIFPIPKVVVELGQSVQAGDELFYDKSNPQIKYVSPVDGEIVAIERGAKRSISNIIIELNKTQKSNKLTIPDLSNSKDVKNFLLRYGLWTSLVERPFDVVPSVDTIPRDIFVTTFDTAPMAADSELVLNGNLESWNKGLEVLATLTDGHIYVGLDGNKGHKSPFALESSDKVKFQYFKGSHPAGNVGVQIHHTAPIKGNEKVWTISYAEVIRWGNIFTRGEFDGNKIFALTGNQLLKSKYVKGYLGSSIKDLLDGNLEGDALRIISGDVLSGQQKGEDDFVDYQEDQITVIKEGKYHEMFGWLVPGKMRPSISRTFPNFLLPNMEYDVDTNTHGEERAFVMSGQYESVLPMDIFPQHLLKAIMTQNIESMEGLGLKELTEEDVALCEFVCTSKTPVQSILRDGLELLKEQG